MSVYVFVNGEVVEKYGPEHMASLQEVARSKLSAPSIRADGMEAIVNHADGRTYDSKSAYYGAVKAAGCEIVGNDSKWKNGALPNKKVRGIGADLARQLRD